MCEMLEQRKICKTQLIQGNDEHTRQRDIQRLAMEESHTQQGECEENKFDGNASQCHGASADSCYEKPRFGAKAKKEALCRLFDVKNLAQIG